MVRDILDADGNIIGSLTMPDDTPEDVWDRNLAEYLQGPEIKGPNLYAGPVSVLVTSQPAVTIATSPPFATPTYRNKHNAVAAPVTCPDNAATNIDFQMTAARQTYGGELIVQNAQFGDWISAEVYDVDSVIPSPYRAATCEAWPSVAKYIIRRYLPVEVSGETISVVIDTRPLIASIPAGLYLRVTYNAIAATDAPNRSAVVNYFLTMAL